MGKVNRAKKLAIKTKNPCTATEQMVNQAPMETDLKNEEEEKVNKDNIRLAVGKGFIKQLLDDTLKNMSAEDQNIDEYFKFLKLINKPQNPTTAHLDAVIAGTFIFTVREVQGEPYILQGVVTKATQDYKYTDKNETETELYSVSIAIRWFAGVPDHFFGTEVSVTDCSRLYIDGNSSDVFLSAEEAVSAYLNKKCTSLYWRLSKLQEAQKNSRTATYLYDLV